MAWCKTSPAPLLTPQYINPRRPLPLPRQVEVLKMGWCKIGGGAGARAVADLVMFNTTLRTLDVRGNGFGNDGARGGGRAGGRRGRGWWVEGGVCWGGWGCSHREWWRLLMPDERCAQPPSHILAPLRTLPSNDSPTRRAHPAHSPTHSSTHLPTHPPGAVLISRGLKEHQNEQLRELDMGYNEIKDEGACALAQVGVCVAAGGGEGEGGTPQTTNTSPPHSPTHPTPPPRPAYPAPGDQGQPQPLHAPPPPTRPPTHPLASPCRPGAQGQPRGRAQGAQGQRQLPHPVWAGGADRGAGPRVRRGAQGDCDHHVT